MSTKRIRQLDWEAIGHTLRRLVNVVGILALIAVVVPFVVYGAPGVVGADDAFVVLSGSMTPTMQPGDVVVVNEVEADAVERGDVITYVNRGSSAPTTHRVIDVKQLESGPAFQTMGDANEDPDARLVHPQQLVGEVATVQGELFVIPYIGHVIQYGQSPLGFLSLVALPVGLLVVTELVVMVRNARANQRNGAAGDERTAANEPIPVETDGDEASASATDGSDSPSDSAGSGGDTISVSGRDVRATTAVLAIFGPYSAWVAYNNPNVVSITLGVAGVVLFVLSAALLLATRGGSDDSSGGATSPDGPTATDGGVQSDADQEYFPIPLHEDGDTTATPESAADPGGEDDE